MSIDQVNLNSPATPHIHWSSLVSILALAPLSLAIGGCGSADVTDKDCVNGSGCSRAGALNGEDGAPESAPVDPATNDKTIQAACGDEYAPVCGSDGISYINSCVAGQGQASVASQGMCPPSSGDCGGVTQLVCGSNGADYGNPCQAQQAGVAVASQGSCTPRTSPSAGCGGNGQPACASDSPAEPAGGAGASNSDGDCAGVYQPVCGSDGVTYANACLAEKAGVSRSSQGACPPKAG